MTEKETPQTLRIDRMLVLYEDGTNVMIIGDEPLWWSIPLGDERFVRAVLVMIACRGEVATMVKVSPDSVYQVSNEELDKVLESLERETAAE